MKKQTDIGLQYLQMLGVRPAKSRADAIAKLDALMGKDCAQLSQLWQEKDIERIYALKNETLPLSLHFSGLYDGDLYRKVCNWIAAHRDAFGQEILEVGCDCGVLSCFLGSLFPNAHITAIDRTVKAVENGRALAKQLQVDNVTFFHCALEDLSDLQFDTVLSVRTAHENLTTMDIQPSFALLLKQAILYGNTMYNYAAELARHVRKGGTLVTIEKMGRTPLFLGWLLDLQAQRLTLQRAHYQQLDCTVLGAPLTLQAVSAKKESSQSGDVYDFWCSLYPSQPGQQQWTGWAAETLLQNLVQELDVLEDGFCAYNNDGAICGKYALWTLHGGLVLYYRANAEQTTVGLYGAEMVLPLAEQLQTLRQRAQAQGLILRSLDATAEKQLD